MSEPGILSGLTVIEGSAFVAAPLGGMTLAQLGADVIRFDQLGGGLDYRRWPLAADGQSLFWAGLNKGKRSMQIDLHSAQGRELVRRTVAAGEPVDELPGARMARLRVAQSHRADLIMVALTGNPDGSSEVDYTVNPATGFPWATGPRELVRATQQRASGLGCGMGGLAATGLLAAERRRMQTGQGNSCESRCPTSHSRWSGNLGRIAEAQLGAGHAASDGNYLYGAFGHDFPTQRRAARDGRRADSAPVATRWSSVTGASRTVARIEAGTDTTADRCPIASRPAIC